MDKLIPVEIEAATELYSVPIEQFTEFEAAYEMTGGIVPTGEIEITQNGQYDVTQYASADVNVQGGITPTGTKQISITSNGTTTEDVTNYATAEITVNVSGGMTPTGTKEIEVDSAGTITEDVTNYASVDVTVPSGSASTPTTSITANPSISVSSSGLITASASASQSVTPTVSEGWVSSGSAGTVSVSGSNTSQLSTQAATTITPTTSQQTAVASGKYTTGNVVVDPIPIQYIIPSGTKSISANGTGIDVKAYEFVDVNVGGGSGALHSLGQYYHTSSYDIEVDGNHVKFTATGNVNAPSICLRQLGTTVNLPTWFTINSGSTVKVEYFNVVNSSNLTWNANAKRANSTTSLTFGISNGTHLNGETLTLTQASTENIGCWFLYIASASSGQTLEFDMAITIDGVRYI